MGILTGTAFIYGEATVTGTISLISLSLYPIAFGTIGGNVLRDIFSVEGDAKVGYPTLPQKIGNISAAKVGGVFFLLTGLLAPLPYLHWGIHSLLSAADSALECTTDLLSYTLVHICLNRCEHT